MKGISFIQINHFEKEHWHPSPTGRSIHTSQSCFRNLATAGSSLTLVAEAIMGGVEEEVEGEVEKKIEEEDSVDVLVVHGRRTAVSERKEVLW
jgi:hypothetical protein